MASRVQDSELSKTSGISRLNVDPLGATGFHPDRNPMERSLMCHHPIRSKNNIGMILALLFMVAPPASAQTVVTAGLVRGVVSDSSNAVDPQATVLLSARDTGGRFTRTAM